MLSTLFIYELYALFYLYTNNPPLLLRSFFVLFYLITFHKVNVHLGVNRYRSSFLIYIVHWVYILHTMIYIQLPNFRCLDFLICFFFFWFSKWNFHFKLSFYLDIIWCYHLMLSLRLYQHPGSSFRKNMFLIIINIYKCYIQ